MTVMIAVRLPIWQNHVRQRKRQPHLKHKRESGKITLINKLYLCLEKTQKIWKVRSNFSFGYFDKIQIDVIGIFSLVYKMIFGAEYNSKQSAGGLQLLSKLSVCNYNYCYTRTRAVMRKWGRQRVKMWQTLSLPPARATKTWASAEVHCFQLAH